MKKIVVILVSVFFLFSFNSFAQQEAQEVSYLKSFYVGQFNLNHANWNAQMEAQLLDGLSGLQSPEFKVFGHTDETGPADFNKELSLKRSELVADKITKLFPESQVEILGITYAPLVGQRVDYRMVLVEVYAEPQLALTDIKDAISALGVTIESGRSENKESHERLEVELEKTNTNVLALSEKFDKPAFNPWNLVFWVIPFLGLLAIILVLLTKKPKEEDNSEWVGVSIQRENDEKKFSVKCEKGEGFYNSPIRCIKHDSLSDLKRSLRSDLNNFLKDDKSESFVSAGLEEKIKKLISSGVIKES